jgi:hypothetical protein
VSKAYEDGSTSLRWIEVQFADDCGIERIVNSDILHEALAPPPGEEKGEG